MKKFYKVITAKPAVVIVLYVLLAAFFGVMKFCVNVNYDMNDYLPEDCRSTKSLEVMKEEFEGGIPNCRAMIKCSSVSEALEYKSKLEAIEGVTDAVWLDDSEDITKPLECMDKDAVEAYYKDGYALIQLTVDDENMVETIHQVRDIIGDDNAIEGTAVLTVAAQENTLEEVSRIAVIVVLFVIMILILTTNSWIEPVVILLGLGTAIIINAGSNIVFGTISFVSNAAGSILLLAVSLDYSVFLIHRFEECRKEFSDPKEAMVEALAKSTISISSSGLTTVIGFAALCLMRFKLGPDLGLVLAKGVGISLICVFTFMPNLILLTYKLLDKTRHKFLLPKFDKFAGVVMKISIPLVALFVLLIVPSYLASGSNEFYYGTSHIFGENTIPGADAKKLDDVFGQKDTYVLLVPADTNAVQTKLSADIKTIPEVKDIISYTDSVGAEIPSAYLDDSTFSKLVSENYSRMVISLNIPYEGERSFEVVETIRNMAGKYYDDAFYLAGNGVNTYDLMNTVTADMTTVNLIAIGAVFLILVITMRSLVTPAILVASIETAIWVNLSVSYFTDKPIFYIAYLIISSVQLGATVDYAILMTDRYKETRKENPDMPKKKAAKDTISSCIVSILTSGSTLTTVGLLLGFMSTHGLLSQIGMFIGRGTLCSMFVVIFILPGCLCLCDGLIVKKEKFPERKLLKHRKGNEKREAESL